MMLCPHLHELILPKTLLLDDNSLVHIANHCPNLTTLVVNIDSISNQSVALVLKRCANLKHLGLQNGKQISAEVFDHISCSSLNKLAISGSDCISTDEVLAAVEAGKVRNLSLMALTSSKILNMSFVLAAVGVTLVEQKVKLLELSGSLTAFLTK